MSVQIHFLVGFLLLLQLPFVVLRVDHAAHDAFFNDHISLLRTLGLLLHAGIQIRFHLQFAVSFNLFELGLSLVVKSGLLLVNRPILVLVHVQLLGLSGLAFLHGPHVLGGYFFQLAAIRPVFGTKVFAEFL